MKDLFATRRRQDVGLGGERVEADGAGAIGLDFIVFGQVVGDLGRHLFAAAGVD